MREPAELGDSELQAKPDWGIGTVVVGLIVLVVVSTIVGSLWLFVSGEKSGGPITLGSLMVGLGGAWVAFFGTAAYCSIRRPGGFGGQLGFKFQFPIDVIRGVGVGFAGQVMVAVIYLPVRLLSSKAADSVSSVAKSDVAAAHGWRWIPIVIGIAVVAPIFEEMFFRGVTLRAFSRRLGPVWGVVISGLIFGLAHFEGIQTPALVAFGWLLAWRATKTGRIGETIFAHATFNGITLIALALN